MKSAGEDQDDLGELAGLLQKVSRVHRMRPPPRAPGVLGPYRLDRVVGRGGMGIVFDAIHVQRDRRVALKIVTRGIDPDPKSRLLREWKSLARVVHPCVVRVEGAGSAEGRFYIAMEFVDGAPLSEAIEGASMPQRRRWFAELCEGVAAAHRAGLVHRDLKPSNVLIRRDTGRACIVDFGLAKPAERRGSLDWSTNGSLVLGTPYYMPPEVHEQLRPDPRQDVFALGLLGLQLVADLRLADPHDGLTTEERARARSTLGRRAGDWLPLLEQAISRERAHRFADAAELLASLRAPRLRRGRMVRALVLTLAGALGFGLVSWLLDG